MPETPVWKIPYPDRGTNPDIPRDLQLLAEKIDSIDLDLTVPPRTARSFVWVDTGSEPPGWKEVPEIWKYNEATQRWSRQWYGPRLPRFSSITIDPAHPYLGDEIIVTGTIVDQMNAPIEEGTVVLLRQDYSGGGGGWQKVGTAQVGPGNKYTVVDPAIVQVGTVHYKVEFVPPNIIYDPGESPERSVTITLPKVEGLRFTSFQPDEVEFTWDALVGADGYEIYQISENSPDKVLLKTVNLPPSGPITITPGELTTFVVRVYKNDITGNPVYGPFSNEIKTVRETQTSTPQGIPLRLHLGESFTARGKVTLKTGHLVTLGEVALEYRKHGDSTWQQVPGSPVNLTPTGEYTFVTTITEDQMAAIYYRARYLGTPYDPSVSDKVSVYIDTTTVTSRPTGVPSIARTGDSFTATGTVTTSDGRPVTQGEVVLQWSTKVTWGSTPWQTAAGPVPVSSSGTYSIRNTISSTWFKIGPVGYRVKYLGSGQIFDSSTSRRVVCDIRSR